MHLSNDPPPEASKFFYQGHQASAFTAALCYLLVKMAAFGY